VAERMSVAEELAGIEARLAEVGDLMSRFTLLEKQYRSDIDRLVMVTEAGNLLGFFKVAPASSAAPNPNTSTPTTANARRLSYISLWRPRWPRPPPSSMTLGRPCATCSVS
jgi:hypothetical protein